MVLLAINDNILILWWSNPLTLESSLWRNGKTDILSCNDVL